MREAYAVDRQRREEERKAYEMAREGEREKEKLRQAHIRAANGVGRFGDGGERGSSG
jgi:hypothetical protein